MSLPHAVHQKRVQTHTVGADGVVEDLGRVHDGDGRQAEAVATLEQEKCSHGTVDAGRVSRGAILGSETTEHEKEDG